jgi:predicted amidohydrolase YtcJ
VISELKEQTLRAKSLIYNANIYTQADGIIADSMAIYKNRIVAIGNRLDVDHDFKSYNRINLRVKTIIPGLVDAHTHFYFFALTFARVNLDEIETYEKCANKIKKYASTLKKNEWVVGEGISPARFKKNIVLDRYKLDKLTGGRPAFIFTKDQHSAWVNSKALEIARYSKLTKNPSDGEIVRFDDGEPTGLLKEMGAYSDIYNLIPEPSKAKINKLYQQALEFAWKNGVTGVHSVDGPKGFEYFAEMAEKNKLGLRINYYFPIEKLDELINNKIYYGTGNDFLRIAGIKIFSDGALGSQTALCFNKYIGSKDNYGIEVMNSKTLNKHVKKAAKLNFPCAIHAIGDKAVSNVLDGLENSPKLHFGARHRIEHMQLMRRKDIKRVKEMNVVASMQPSHCPSDISIMRKFWGKRSQNAFLIKTLQKNKIDLAFGSDCPIEPLLPLEGIAAAVRRARKNSRDVFYPYEKISATDALYHYTVGPAIATGQQHCRGYLLPGYPADFVVLSDDITKIAPSKIYDVKVLATVIDGKTKYTRGSFSI